MTMIERVARVMVAADSCPEGSILFDIHLAEFGDGYRKNARAAIEAMREPDHAMRLASKRYKRKAKVYSGPECYREMIDAALKEKA